MSNRVHHKIHQKSTRTCTLHVHTHTCTVHVHVGFHVKGTYSTVHVHVT